MSKKGPHRLPHYFDFVVPPLEGLWWQEGINGVDYQHKEKFHFIALIHMPEFVTQAVVNWAVKEARKKKQLNLNNVELMAINEGLCVQALHVGPYDSEPATVNKIHQFIAAHQLKVGINNHRHHHEIYLSDPRRTKVERLQTVLRIPVKKRLS